MKFKLISLLKNFSYLTICVLFFYTHSISSELFTDGYNEDGDLVLHFNAQRSFRPLEIPAYVSQKIQNATHTYVVVVGWDCEAKVDDMYESATIKYKLGLIYYILPSIWIIDGVKRSLNSKDKARVLRECHEDTEKIRKALYKIQRTSVEHSRVKRRLDELKNEVNIHENYYTNTKADQRQEEQIKRNLQGLQTALTDLLEYQDRFDSFLPKIRHYLSKNQVDTIDEWIHLFQNFNTDNENNNEIFKHFLSELKSFRSATFKDKNKILNELNSFFTEDPDDLVKLSDEDKNKINSLQEDLFEFYRIVDQLIDLEYPIRQSIKYWASFNEAAKEWAQFFHTLQKQTYYSIVEYSIKYFFKTIEVPNEIKEIINSNPEPALHQIEQLLNFIQSKENSNYISSYLNNLYSSYASSHFGHIYLNSRTENHLFHKALSSYYRFQSFLLKIKELFYNIGIGNSTQTAQGTVTHLALKRHSKVNSEPSVMNIINYRDLQLKLLTEKNIHKRINRSIDEVIELFDQMKVKVDNNYKKSSSHKIFKIIETMIDQHQNRSRTLSNRATQLYGKIQKLKNEIKNNQEDLFEVWTEHLDIKDKSSLDFIESVPAFSFSFMLHLLPEWLLNDEQIEWMRRQDAYRRSWNQMREARRRAHGR